MSLSEIEILVVGPELPAMMDTLEALFRVRQLWQADDQAAFLQANGVRIRGMVTSFVHGADAGLLDALPNLEIIAHYGVGTDKLDLEAARRRNIAVTTTPDINEPVADLAMTLLLSIARRVCVAERFVRNGDWRQGAFPLSTHVGGKTCGIVGLGRIGRSVARRAEAFDMQVIYHGPKVKPDAPYAYYDSLKALASASDFLVLCTPGGEDTRHLVNADILATLGPKGYLINVARGSVVDEIALVQALQTGQIAGAGLDVFEREPLADSPLMQLENVILLPHIASATVETRHEMGDVVVENLKAHFTGRPLKTPALSP